MSYLGGTTAAQLNIAALSKRTGVARDTLRKWEQRYAILQPTRTAGGQRRYTELDVARVEWLRARLGEGYRIGEAASLLGAADTIAPRSTEELRDALIAAAERGDVEPLSRLLDHAFTLHPVERALDEIVRPLLEHVGEAWAAGTLTVAQEHLVSEALRARLERLLADARGGVRGVAVLGCAPGERHDIGLVTLAVLLRADGWQVAYLGCDTPFADAVALARDLDARLLCVSATMPEAVAALQEGLAATPLPPGLELLVGGRATSQEIARRLGSRYLDGDLARVVRTIAKLGR